MSAPFSVERYREIKERLDRRTPEEKEASRKALEPMIEALQWAYEGEVCDKDGAS
jgi:hypothetical protein